MNTFIRSTFVLLLLVTSALLFSQCDELLEEMYRSPKSDSTQSVASRQVLPVRIVDARAVIEEGQLRLKWSTVDPNGELLSTYGEARYGTNGSPETSTGESKAKYEQHIKRIDPYQTGATYTYQIFARTETTATVASEVFTFNTARLQLSVTGVRFDVGSSPVAYVAYHAQRATGQDVETFGLVEWRPVGTSVWYDHQSAEAYALHESRIPAKEPSTSNPPATLGPDLVPGMDIEYRVTVTDVSGQTVMSPLDTVTVPALEGGPEDSWSAEDFGELPAGNWTLLDSAARGNVGKGKANHQQSVVRISYTSPPGDSKPAFKHQVNVGDIVDPLGVDSEGIPFDARAHDRVLLRYHMWLSDYSGRPGKYIFFGVGQGWIGTGYAKGTDYGTAGGGANAMQPTLGKHPDGGKNNSVRLLASFSDGKLNSDYFGEKTPKPDYIPPTGRWVPVDIIIDRNNGYELYVDGKPLAATTGRSPIVGGSWTDCKKLWWRVRLMHGGTPELDEFKAGRDYSHWFGGFFVYAE